MTEDEEGLALEQVSLEMLPYAAIQVSVWKCPKDSTPVLQTTTQGLIDVPNQDMQLQILSVL